MIVRQTAWLTLATMALWLGASSACRDNLTPAITETRVIEERAFELGAHRVQLSVPAGWEDIDQGKQKRFRKGEVEIVLQNLGPATASMQDLDALVDWGLAAVGHDQRRDVKSRQPVTIDGRQAMDVETWSRLDHTWPQRLLFVRADNDVLALYTTRLADEDTAKAFESIRDSLHFAVSTRR